MIYLLLFVEFFQIGAFTFGGGYAMISLIRERMLAHGWLTETELLNMIAVAESTPGPIAINMATFVGASQGGLFGSIVATLGVVMPSFLIILLIAAILKNLLKYDSVQAFLGGVRPACVALILCTALTMLLGSLLGISSIYVTPRLSLPACAIFALVLAFAFLYKRLRKKKPSPVMIILLGAALGMLIYPFA